MQKEIAATAGQEHCALVLASNLSDGAVIAEVLVDTSVETINYATVEELLSEARAGVGTIIIAEQALVDDALELLPEFFAEQPPWSKVPLIILTAHFLDAQLEAKSCGFAILCEARPCLNDHCGWRLWSIRSKSQCVAGIGSTSLGTIWSNTSSCSREAIPCIAS